MTAGWPWPPAQREAYLAWVLDWTGGQPYLTHRVCQDLATAALPHGDARDVTARVQALCCGAASWSDPHLGYIRDRIVYDKLASEALLGLYQDLLLGAQMLDDERSPLHAALKLTGLVKVFPDGLLRSRNAIYTQVFNTAWVHAVQQTLPAHRPFAARPDPDKRYTGPTARERAAAFHPPAVTACAPEHRRARLLAPQTPCSP